MSPFSFSLSHTLTMFLSIFLDCTSQAKALSFLCFSLSETHTKMVEWLSVLLQLPIRPNGLCFLFSSFLFLQCVPHALHHFSLIEVKPLPCFGHFSINERASLEDFWNKLINELWQMCVLESKECHMHPTISLSNTLRKEIFNPSLQSKFMLANPTQSFSFSLNTTLVNMSAGFSSVWIFSNSNNCCSTTSLNQWYLTSMCFEREWYVEFLLKSIAL